jgi:hypothetical protein
MKEKSYGKKSILIHNELCIEKLILFARKIVF